MVGDAERGRFQDVLWALGSSEPFVADNNLKTCSSLWALSWNGLILLWARDLLWVLCTVSPSHTLVIHLVTYF